MATDWDVRTKRLSRIAFGRTAGLTWAIMHLLFKLSPTLIIKTLLHDLTVLNVDEVYRRLSPDDLAFVKRMIESLGAGPGFMHDVEHRVENLATITRPVLVMYSPNDKTVSPKNALYVAGQVAACELYPVPSDTHLIWIGKTADQVWEKRLSFLAR